MKHRGLNQLICAAVVNDRFRETLLRDATRAIGDGYQGYSFSLSPDERDLITHIRAQRVEDFAAQVYDWISGNGYVQVNGSIGQGKNGHNGNGYSQLSTTEPLIDLCRAPLTARA